MRIKKNYEGMADIKYLEIVELIKLNKQEDQSAE